MKFCLVRIEHFDKYLETMFLINYSCYNIKAHIVFFFENYDKFHP